MTQLLHGLARCRRWWSRYYVTSGSSTASTPR